MDTALLITRIVLAAIFVVAGLTKLVDRAGSRQAIIDFGLPVKLATPFGLALPLAELVVAMLLLAGTTAWWGAVGALALLLLFVAGISYNLAKGRKPDCHCFGQLYSAPVGPSTLARNGVLAVVALFIILQGRENAGPSAFGWLAGLSAVEVVMLVGLVVVLILVAVEGWLLLNLMRQNGRLMLRIESLEANLGGDTGRPAPTPALPAVGLPIGSPAPVFQLSGIFGETLTLDALRAQAKPLMLIFSDPGCGPCNALMPEVAKWQGEHLSKMTIALVSRGTVEANRAKNKEHGLMNILMQRDREVSESYKAYGTPSAVIVRSDGTIGSPIAGGADAIRTLVAQTVGMPSPKLQMRPIPNVDDDCNCRNGNGNGNGHHASPTNQITKIGESAPVFTLPDLSGKNVDLVSFQGHETVLLFWRPSCGFCARMLNDLKAWEANPPQDAPKLLIVSEGTVEENVAMGLQSTVVLDQGFIVGRDFGANGTPSAVLVDRNGNIASDVAVGASAVLALAGER